MNKNSKSVVYVTGGSRGIGKIIVEKFQSQGWLVASCATTSNGVSMSEANLSLVCNVADRMDVRNAIEKIMKKFGRLDAIINNAGIAGENSLNVNNDDDLWHRIIDVNLHGTYYTCKYALPHLPNQTGRIVNISSILGLKGVPDQTAYCAAKHGVLGLTKALSHYVAPRQITVNAICPGWVRTDMMLNRMHELQRSEKDITALVPLGRVIEPKEIADLAYYLIASENAANITGQAISIDGGVLA